MQNKYPELTDRIQSTFIDTVFIVILMFIFSALLEKFDNTPEWIRVALFIGIWVVYEPLCTCLGATLGNYFKKIRVRAVTNTHKRINFFQALARYIVKLLLGWLSFLTIGSNAEKRAIHDFVGGSVVIKV